MIRTNLSTRPFYNERGVHVVLAAVAMLVLLASVYNATRIVRLSRVETRLSTAAARDEARAGELLAAAARLRGSVDGKALGAESAAAHEANALIDRRTFSWTELFNRFETTLPDDVRIAAVHPRIDKDGHITLEMVVVAKTPDDVSRFMVNLQGTGAFTGLGPNDEHVTDDGNLQATLEFGYRPGGAAPAATPASGKAESR